MSYFAVITFICILCNSAYGRYTARLQTSTHIAATKRETKLTIELAISQNKNNTVNVGEVVPHVIRVENTRLQDSAVATVSFAQVAATTLHTCVSQNSSRAYIVNVVNQEYRSRIHVVRCLYTRTKYFEIEIEVLQPHEEDFGMWRLHNFYSDDVVSAENNDTYYRSAIAAFPNMINSLPSLHIEAVGFDATQRQLVLSCNMEGGLTRNDLLFFGDVNPPWKMMYFAARNNFAPHIDKTESDIFQRQNDINETLMYNASAETDRVLCYNITLQNYSSHDAVSFWQRCPRSNDTEYHTSTTIQRCHCIAVPTQRLAPKTSSIGVISVDLPEPSDIHSAGTLSETYVHCGAFDTVRSEERSIASLVRDVVCDSSSSAVSELKNQFAAMHLEERFQQPQNDIIDISCHSVCSNEDILTEYKITLSYHSWHSPKERVVNSPTLSIDAQHLFLFVKEVKCLSPSHTVSKFVTDIVSSLQEQVLSERTCQANYYMEIGFDANGDNVLCVVSNLNKIEICNLHNSLDFHLLSSIWSFDSHTVMQTMQGDIIQSIPMSTVLHSEKQKVKCEHQVESGHDSLYTDKALVFSAKYNNVTNTTENDDAETNRCTGNNILHTPPYVQVLAHGHRGSFSVSCLYPLPIDVLQCTNQQLNITSVLIRLNVYRVKQDNVIEKQPNLIYPYLAQYFYDVDTNITTTSTSSKMVVVETYQPPSRRIFTAAVPYIFLHTLLASSAKETNSSIALSAQCAFSRGKAMRMYKHSEEKAIVVPLMYAINSYDHESDKSEINMRQDVNTVESKQRKKSESVETLEFVYTRNTLSSQTVAIVIGSTVTLFVLCAILLFVFLVYVTRRRHVVGYRSQYSYSLLAQLKRNI